MVMNTAEMDNKRKRSANWLESEKDLLINIVKNYTSIIEHKKTDGATMQKKAAQWQIIADQYNSRTTHCFRAAEVLKAQWERLKKWARREAAMIRKNFIETGEAPPPNKDDPDPLLNRVLSILRTSAKGSFNQNDSDSVVPANAETVLDQALINKWILTDDSLERSSIIEESYNVIALENEHNYTKESKEQDPLQAENDDWRSDNTQESQELQNENTMKSSEKQTYSARRPLHNKVSSLLEKLNRKKIEVKELEQALAMEENVKTNIQQNLDIKIKREKLKQEQIRTKLLLIRQRKLLLACRKRNTTNK